MAHDSKRPRIFAVVLLAIMTLVPSTAFGQTNGFVTRSGDKLMEDGREFRFVSFNVPNLHLVEDNFAFEATNEWRFPDQFEVEDALESVKRLGGRVVRTYVISIARKDGPNPIPAHVVRPGQFDEEAFVALDRVVATAGRLGVRVVVPLVDQWKWWGGIGEYAAWRGKPPEAFWTDPDVIGDFEQTVKYVLNRKNTVTGVRYKDDPAILAWETGNELASPSSWTRRIAALLKTEDPKHLVWDGMYIGQHDVQDDVLDDPNVDVVSSHHYPGRNYGGAEMAADVAKIRARVAGRKAYVVGEFGFIPLDDARAVLDAAISNGLAGAMIWSLRFHNRDGGFYWHSEGASGDAVKAYHFPGFATGASYQESAVVDLMRTKAYEIQGVPAPPLPAPAPPALLAIRSADAISWRGSVGASGYDVERADRRDGPWTLVGADVDDTAVQYRPLFADPYAEPGATYFYRARAKNVSGTSAPSNVVGPVRVDDVALVDELIDATRIFARGGPAELVRANARPYKEDASRLAGRDGAWVVYRTTGPIRSAAILAFADGDAPRDLELSVSTDGAVYTRVEPKVRRFPTEVNPYGYKLPVRYDVTGDFGQARFLKIAFRSDAQLSRVEVRSGSGARR